MQEQEQSRYVRFGWHPKKSEKLSVEAGRPVYEDQEYIEIFGDKTSIVHRAVRPEDKAEYAKQYDAWKRGQDQSVVGTKLDMVPGPATRGQLEELAHHKIYTVEHLAAAADTHIQAFGTGGLKLRQWARDYLETAKLNAPVDQLRAQLAEAEVKRVAQESRFEALERELRAMREQNDKKPKLKREDQP